MPFATSLGARIYWEEEGQGDPLLMIMGLGYSLHMWREMRQMLARHFRAIVFDNRGVGSSDPPGGLISMAAMARDAAAVMDAAGVPTAHVLGMSMGGMIAQELTLTFPERVRKLVLGCTNCGALRSVPTSPKALELLVTRFTHRPEERAETIIPWLYHPETSRESIEQDLSLLRVHYPKSSVVLKQLGAVAGWSSLGRLKRIQSPTLVIHGEDDRLVPAGNARIIARRIPNAKLVMIARAGHIFPTDQTESSVSAILEFLLGSTSTGSAAR